jgi:hypothetical protein
MKASNLDDISSHYSLMTPSEVSGVVVENNINPKADTKSKPQVEE